MFSPLDNLGHVHGSRKRFVMGAYASMRRSRRNGQLRRVSSRSARIDFAEKNLFRVVRGLRDDAAEGIGEEAAAPELKARTLDAIAAHIPVLVANAVHPGNVDAVGNGVGALNRLPCIVLRCAELILLRRMPADGGGIEQHLGALQRGETRSLGIPLIPADERADAAECRVHGLESKIAQA